MDSRLRSRRQLPQASNAPRAPSARLRGSAISRRALPSADYVLRVRARLGDEFVANSKLPAWRRSGLERANAARGRTGARQGVTAHQPWTARGITTARNTLGRPTFDESITAEDKKGGPDDVEFEKDELYDEAARIVVQSGQASISYLQRKMRIGFSRAARLVVMMEAEGLVSAASGGKAREVLVPKDYFDEVDAQLR